MLQVKVNEATKRLLELIEAARKGEEIFIVTDDQQAFQLKPVPFPRPQFGSAKGLIEVADDFEAPLEDFDEYMRR
jgi:antitoxin (DNA-binding transcriptional repressor) of toxin-antitoxin stability system